MKAKLKEDLKLAMKARDQLRMDTIRSLLSAMQYEEMQKGVEDLPSEAVLTILKSEIKKRKEELEFAEKAARADLNEKLLREISIIESFMPAQLDAAALEKILVDLKSQDAAINMGSAMKILKERYAGQYDGKLASDLAKKVLA